MIPLLPHFHDLYIKKDCLKYYLVQAGGKSVFA